MRYGSVCSGIEAASAAWQPLGWNAAWFSEVEPFPCSVLDRHYPNVPNLGDITSEDFIERVKGEGSVDALVGGTPCQSFSVAGLRRGLDDDRGNLSLRFMQLVDALRPRWVIWENVPGVLSANEGRDFGAILGALEECGYGWAYRILDAQYLGVAQRRRRVFVVGCLGSWGPAGEVLSVRESLQGHPAPRRKARQDVATTLTQGADSSGEGGYAGRRREDDVNLVSNTLKGRHDSGQGEGTPVIAFDSTQITHPENRSKVDDRAPQLTESGHAPAVAGFSPFQSSASATVGYAEERSPTLKGSCGSNMVPGVQERMMVRRLTPRECERLQGFPDDYTLVAWRGKSAEECPDSPRYRAIGNSMAVPVMRWIGERIELMDSIIAD